MDEPRRGAAVPPAVWLLCLLHGLLLASFSVAVPTYRAPDEPHHVDLVLAVARGQAWPWPEPTGRRDSAQIAASLSQANYADPSSFRESEPAAFRVSGALPRGQRPSFAELGPDSPSQARNPMPQHPPLYYLLGGVTVGLTGLEESAFDRVVGGLRLGNAVLVAPLPLLAYLATRRVTGNRAVALAAASFPLAVPQLTHTGSTAGNDPLLVVLLGWLTVLLARVLTGDTGRRTAALVGLVAGLALLTKGFALVAPAWIAAAYLRASGRAGLGASLRAGAMALAVALGTGGWWWLRNLVRYGTLQPAGQVPPAAPADTAPDVLAFLGFLATALPQRYWGAFGWLQLPLPWTAVWAATAVVVTAAAVAVTRARRVGSAPLTVALLLFPTAGTLAIVTGGAWVYYRTYAVIAGIQGRYLLAGVVGLAAVTAAGLAALVAVPRRALLPPAVFIAALALQGVAIATVITGFWTAPARSDLATGLAALLSWSPWPPAAVVLCWAGVAGIALALLGLLVADVSAHRTSAPRAARAAAGQPGPAPPPPQS